MQKIRRVNCIKVLAILSAFLEPLFHLFIHGAKVQLQVVPILKYAQRREVWRNGMQLQSFLRFKNRSFYFRSLRYIKLGFVGPEAGLDL